MIAENIKRVTHNVIRQSITIYFKDGSEKEIKMEWCDFKKLLESGEIINYLKHV